MKKHLQETEKKLSDALECVNAAIKLMDASTDSADWRVASGLNDVWQDIKRLRKGVQERLEKGGTAGR